MFDVVGPGLPAVQAVLLQSSFWRKHARHPVRQLHLPRQLKVLSGNLSLLCFLLNEDHYDFD
jgi:hypothetical protein